MTHAHRRGAGELVVNNQLDGVWLSE